MQGINTIFYVIVLIMSVVVHEVAHGLVADSQGDPTARYAGRLTLNPIKHLDMMGSIILPLLLIIFNAGFVVGWAKPVPYIEGNLRNKKWGSVLVASAGIISNFAIAAFFGIASRLIPIAASVKQSIVMLVLSNDNNGLGDVLSSGIFPKIFLIFIIIIFINIVLGIFNLIPIPPLDGSKILFGMLPGKYLSRELRAKIEYFSIPLLLIFIIFVWPLIFPLIGFLFSLLTGI